MPDEEQAACLFPSEEERHPPGLALTLALRPVFPRLLTALLVAARLAMLLLLLGTSLGMALRLSLLRSRLRAPGARLEARDGLLLHLAVHELLDGRHQRPLLGADERHRLALGAGAAGAADAVHVVLGDVRQVVVDDMR